MRKNFKMTIALRRMWLWTLPIAAYSSLSLVRLYFNYFDIPQFALPLEAALTFAMGMLVLFRINRAYERWWEARTLWGALVNASRNLAVKTRQLAQVDQADKLWRWRFACQNWYRRLLALHHQLCQPS